MFFFCFVFLQTPKLFASPRPPYSNSREFSQEKTRQTVGTMSFIGSPFVSRRSNFGSNSSLNRTMSPSRFNSTSGYGTYNPSSYSSSYTPTSSTYASSYSPNYSSSNHHSTSSYKPYSSHSARSTSYDHAPRSGHYDSGLSLRSSSTTSLNDLTSSPTSYLNRASPSSYLNSGTNSNLNTFRRSSLNSRRRHNTLSPARDRINSLGSLNSSHYTDYSSPTAIAYSNYVIRPRHLTADEP